MSSLNELLAHLCAGLNEAEAAAIMKEGCLTIGEMDVSLHLAGELDPDGLHVYCELGPVPKGAAGTNAVERLLEFNLYLFRRDAPSFALDTASGHAVLMLRLPLPELTGELLVQSLGSLADLASRWKQTYFVDGSMGIAEGLKRPESAYPKRRMARGA